MALIDIISDRVQTIIDSRTNVFIKEVQKELLDQGHVNTGKLRDSIRKEVERFPGLIRVTVFMLEYGFAIDKGIKPDRIPYSGFSGSGGTSDYIQGLQDYFITKGLSTDNALSAAFATANKHKQEGMPTKASFRFSNNGKRTGFFSDPLQKLRRELEVLNSEIASQITLSVREVFKRHQGEFEKLVVL